MTNIEELLTKVQLLEDEGFVIGLKWDGEREKGKKTLFATSPKLTEMVRRDGDDMWELLESLLEEIEGKKTIR
ncbi:MAG: hypothetical protein MJA31_18680 [Clostridia bacterium]|nr:hypothetical protein [Clostridia bacterium]